MSWTDSVKLPFTITTGDGLSYTFAWKNARFALEFNTAEFLFTNISGSLIDKRKPKGERYELEIYFTGDDNVTQALAFLESSKDSRNWIINHPFYGRLVVQPLGLGIDNSAFNVTKITGTVVATLQKVYPTQKRDPADLVKLNVATVNAAQVTGFSNGPLPGPVDLNAIAADLGILYTQSNPLTLGAIAGAYLNAFNAAKAAVNTYAAIADAQISDAAAMIATVQTMIMMPGQFATLVQNRLTNLVANVNALRLQLNDTVTIAEKSIYQFNIGNLVTAMAYAAATPTAADYTTRINVQNAIDTLTDTYNQYLADLDSLQTLTGDLPESFVPDANSIILLDQLMNLVLSNLFNIAFNALQQRTLILEKDSNWLVLAHRFYPADDLDSSIDRIMADNNAGLSTILQVPKNSVIAYYV